ncbi:S-adenosyl-L-methionine-dependent methyltransferase [Durotheca rogersii]|uniref:S-adenosyl-L-methionine-dependent methyltransferase n=1 Tax=Durotheca rogersii TaxID=419775 RepID=UPI00221F24D9|nr:S-adenosyl-L-methionine-dependent methyltransferase [Durotheca rogersii]KAI5866986.1 S-adenosyl-L-methionine-dependent methyltransferase [Durotheca rogersii]
MASHEERATASAAEYVTSAAVGPGDIDAAIEAAPLEEGDGYGDDVDSALGDGDNASSTASLTESIMQYRTLNGRTYHSSRLGTDKYWGPNDERQNEAMDMNHHFLTLCLNGKLFLSPLKDDIQKVLDIGTGTGLWPIDMGDAYPNCEVIGTDLSPIQPSWCPPNVRFEIDDAEQTWTFAAGSFDFVHARYMIGGISDWPRFFRQAYAALKPGGWVESFEVEADYRSDDGTLAADSAMYAWRDLFNEGGAKLGCPFNVITDDLQRKGMQDAGFVDISVRDLKVPMGPWPANPKLKELGQWAQYIFEQDLEGYVMFMWNKVLNRSLEEMQVFLAAYRKELRSRSIHAYLPQRVVYARKPENA